MTIALSETLMCAEAQPVIFFLDSQLSLILMRSTSTINNSQMDLQRAFIP